MEIISLRKKQCAFYPNASQYTLTLGPKFFGFWKQSIDKKQNIFAIINILSVERKFRLSKINLFENQLWLDLLELKVNFQNIKSLELKSFQTVRIFNKID